MWTGAIIGAGFGVVFYAFRNGGTLLMRDLQTSFGMALGQAIAHMIVPSLTGLAIGALLT
ncbi:hypothetical protein [Oricola indica]|uniref:hypothetical protein n=1 Tax=Oricola indica TaxID=2872591 RepID=UPI003CCC3A4D